jgi:hypothetical protein
MIPNANSPTREQQPDDHATKSILSGRLQTMESVVFPQVPDDEQCTKERDDGSEELCSRSEQIQQTKSARVRDQAMS